MMRHPWMCLFFGHKRRGTGRHCKRCGAKVFESLFRVVDNIPPSLPRTRPRRRYMREGNND